MYPFLPQSASKETAGNRLHLGYQPPEQSAAEEQNWRYGKIPLANLTPVAAKYRLNQLFLLALEIRPVLRSP